MGNGHRILRPLGPENLFFLLGSSIKRAKKTDSFSLIIGCCQDLLPSSLQSGHGRSWSSERPKTTPSSGLSSTIPSGQARPAVEMPGVLGGQETAVWILQEVVIGGRVLNSRSPTILCDSSISSGWPSMSAVSIFNACLQLPGPPDWTAENKNSFTQRPGCRLQLPRPLLWSSYAFSWSTPMSLLPSARHSMSS